MDILILDDDPHRHGWFRAAFPAENLASVSTYAGAISMLKSGRKYHMVFLDHDLNLWGSSSTDGNGYQFTGADVAWYIANEMPDELRPNLVWIHSKNPDGAENITNILKVQGIKTRTVPFGSF